MNKIIYYLNASLLCLLVMGPTSSPHAMNPHDELTVISHSNFQKHQETIYDTHGQTVALVDGNPVTCLYSGPFFEIDSFIPEPGFNAPQLEEWARNFCKTWKYSKISLLTSLENGLPQGLEATLAGAKFEQKTYTYQASFNDFLKIAQNKIKDLEVIHPNILPLDPSNVPLMGLTLKTYVEFSKTMLIPGVFQATAQKTIDSGGKIYVFQADDKTNVQGVISCAFSLSAENARKMYVDSLYVAPMARGKNIAKELVKQLLKTAEENNVATIYWQTGLNRIEAQDLYENLGIPINGIEFRYEPKVLDQIGTFLPDILSNLQLNSSSSESMKNLFNFFNRPQ